MLFKPLYAGYKVGPWGWNAPLMPEEEFRGRLNTLSSEMQKRDLDAVVLFGAGDPTWKNGHVCYFTNSNVCYARWDALVVPRNRKPTLVGNFIPRDIPWEIRGATWLRDVRAFFVRERIPDEMDGVLIHKHMYLLAEIMMLNPILMVVWVARKRV